MPHIIIEHSNDLSAMAVNVFLPKIVEQMVKVKDGNFDSEACKLRALQFDKYYVGSKNENSSSFFHVTIKILAGRSAAVKKEVAQLVCDEAKTFLENQNLRSSRIDLSVDIVDMERDCYQKISI